MTGKRHEEGAELIREAFARARESGAPEWQTMTAAVLKNRLLDLTDRSFAEAQWDASTFRTFLEQFGDVVSVDWSRRPPSVTLLEATDFRAPIVDAHRARADIGPRRRIRSDLWAAILDYSGTHSYVWQGGEAVPHAPDQVPAGADVLPSLTQAEFREWRSKFVERLGTDHAAAVPFLRTWLEREQPLGMLPSEFRIPWVIELKSRVLNRLEDWFRMRGIAAPSDLIVGEDESPERGEDLDDLRGCILEAVRTMTVAELKAVHLPASVLLRIKR